MVKGIDIWFPLPYTGKGAPPVVGLGTVMLPVCLAVTVMVYVPFGVVRTGLGVMFAVLHEERQTTVPQKRGRQMTLERDARKVFFLPNANPRQLNPNIAANAVGLRRKAAVVVPTGTFVLMVMTT